MAGSSSPADTSPVTHSWLVEPKMPSANLQAIRKSRRLARVLSGTENDAVCNLLAYATTSCEKAGWEKDEPVREGEALVVKMWAGSGVGGRTYMGCWRAVKASHDDTMKLGEPECSVGS